jgi:hypothetical protein
MNPMPLRSAWDWRQLGNCTASCTHELKLGRGATHRPIEGRKAAIVWLA